MRRRGKANWPAGRRLAALLGACLLIFVTGACGGSGSIETAGSDIAPESEDTTAAPPETEDTEATEDPVTPDEQDVSVELPGLPIGGGPVSSTDTYQCVDVGWTDPPVLPEWIGVKVTGVAFLPEDAFALTDEPCDTGTPHCLEGEVLITNTQRCHLAVAWTDPTLQDPGELYFTGGTITCSAERAADCEQFRADVESAGPQSADLDPPPVVESGTESSQESETADATADGGEGGG